MPMQYAAYDLQAAKFVTLTLGGGAVEFQFAPKLNSDSQTGDWDEKINHALAEPIANYRGANSRVMSLEWTYIIDGGQWTADKIAAQCRNMRGYFRAAIVRQQDLVAKITLGAHGGGKALSVRMHSADIKHSGPLIGGKFYLRTDVTATIKSWVTTNLPIQPIAGKIDKITPDWY